MPPTTPTSNAAWLDQAGTVASTACAIHCGLVALAPAFLPLMGLGFLHDETYEWLLLMSAVGLAALAAVFGHRMHGSWAISLGFFAGILALDLARLAEVAGIEGGLALALAGGGLLVTSHTLNLRRCRSCNDGACA